jgi:hypothetical protein
MPVETAWFRSTVLRVVYQAKLCVAAGRAGPEQSVRCNGLGLEASSRRSPARRAAEKWLVGRLVRRALAGMFKK